MLKIGEFSKLSRISIRMLRHYDENGLLTPKNTDPYTNYRYYSEAQLMQANRISALRAMGFGLAAVSEILQQYQDPQALLEFLMIRKAETEETLMKTQQQIQLLQTTINQLRKDGTMTEYIVTLKELPARYVASVRQIIPDYTKEGMLWALMQKETASLSLQFADPCYSLAIFHDGEYKESDVDIEVQCAVKGSYHNTEHVVFKEVPAVQIASATFQGSYDKLPQANAAVANWIHENGYDYAGLSFCIYHVSPNQAKTPEELVTEVCYPVKRL